MLTQTVPSEILLVIPVRSGYSGVTIDLGFMCLHSALADHGIQSSILHCPHEGIASIEDWRMFLTQNTHLKIIGFRAYSVDHNSVKAMAAAAREIVPEATTIVGGPHPSCLPEYVLEDMDAMDYAFVGEGEIGFPLFCEGILGDGDVSAVPGLAYRSGERVLKNEKHVQLDLDQLPKVRWEDLDVHSYPTFLTSLPFIPVMATRGCPYQCTYCAGFNIVGRKMRFRSVENVIEELQHLKRIHNITAFNFSDDELTLNRDYFVSLCRAMIDAKLNLRWECSNGVRLDTLDEEVLDLMYRAGCRYISVGIESGSDRILTKIKKKVDIATIKERLALVRQSKIIPQGLFMLGFPGETREEMLQTIQLAIDLDIDKTNFSIFMPLPGSEAFDDLVKEGLISLDTLNWDDMKPDRTIFERPGMPSDELRALQRKAYFRFYMRPAPLRRLARELLLSPAGWKALWSKIRSVFLSKAA